MTTESQTYFRQYWSQGLGYEEFLRRYANPDQRSRWHASKKATALTEPQSALLAGFSREMHVLVMAGAWCGDCVNQCPIFEAFAVATTKIQLRYLDRDDVPELAEQLEICGGRRVPTVVFLDEEGNHCGRYGDKTLSQFRKLAAELSGAACSTGLPIPADSLRPAIIQDWLDEFERIQLMLRLSARLRQKHGD
jgi:hypothetical protein